MSQNRIKFLTFNTWGLKFVSKLRKERLQQIALKLAKEHKEYDVIALQEIWVKEDWDFILDKCEKYFPFNRIFFSGILSGPGLAILSKIPIESTFLYRFPINGRPSAFWRGDWYVGKSVAVTLLKPIEEGSFPIAILNSHMHAPYSLIGDAAYECHRSCQAWDFSKLAKLLSKAGYAVVIVGDLNSRPGSLPHKFLTLETTLVDSWEQLYGAQDLNYIKTLPPDLQIEIGGTTCDSFLNTWRADRKPEEACRLDYALIDGSKLKTVSANVAFIEQIPNVGSYSDHFAYRCELEVLKSDFQDEIVSISAATIDRIEYHNEMLSLLKEYKKVCEWQKNWRWTHFLVSVFLVIAIHVITTFTADRASWSPIFWTFASTVVGITGTINGLIALLFGKSEARALEEVRLEVLDNKRHLETFVYFDSSSSKSINVVG